MNSICSKPKPVLMFKHYLSVLLVACFSAFGYAQDDCPDATSILSLETFDFYSSELVITITDAEGNATPYNIGFGAPVEFFSVELTAGTYNVSIAETYGDGNAAIIGYLNGEVVAEIPPLPGTPSQF